MPQQGELLPRNWTKAQGDTMAPVEAKTVGLITLFSSPRGLKSGEYRTVLLQFCLVYPDAITQGLPVIYSKGQGFDEQFEEGTVGYHVDSKN